MGVRVRALLVMFMFPIGSRKTMGAVEFDRAQRVYVSHRE